MGDSKARISVLYQFSNEHAKAFELVCTTICLIYVDVNETDGVI
jgi:hypothetical protein